MKILNQEDITPIHLSPGDTLRLIIRDELGANIKVVDTPITESVSVDTMLVFSFENEFGLANGIGGIFGKKIK